MFKQLDPSMYRDVTSALLPPGIAADAEVALEALNAQFGVGGGETAILDGMRVTKHDPSGLLIRVTAGQIEGVWAPEAVTDEQVADWRERMAAALKPAGIALVNRVVLCAGPIEHRWELPEVGVRLSPPPIGAPRPPMLMADHAVMLRVRIETCAQRSINGTFAARKLEWWTLLLNAATYLRCGHTLHRRSAWAWDRHRDDRSKWMDLEYFSPEILDDTAVEAAASQAPSGCWVDDAEYYIGFGAATDHSAVLPASLGATLTAAESLAPEHHRDLRRACRLISAADEAAPMSSSLSYVALVSAVETLAKNWRPKLGATARFKQLLTDMLPCYRDVEDGAAELYRLRCDLVHEGIVFPGDWIGMSHDEDRREWSAHWGLARVARLATVNWLRARAGLPHVPAA
ncbi:MAG: hypothetical protein KF866_04610 [Phycisphaeraceae bacterium]|nr:hypothetical protein [Phycisphaeraceae bacterium]